MKKLILNAILLSCFFTGGFSQIKVINNGYVGVGGINPPLAPFHALGWAQIFNDAGQEIKFRPNNGNQADIGHSHGKINFWHPFYWSNSGWTKIEAAQFITHSDANSKKNVMPLGNCIQVIRLLQPKKYNTVDSIETEESSRQYYGFIAQDVLNILPDIVELSNKGYGLNYTGIIPFLVGAVKEQSETIDSLKQALSNNSARTTNENAKTDSLSKDIKELREQIQHIQNSCCQTPSNGNSSQQEEQIKNALSSGLTSVSNNENGNILLQNIPNPFDNSTTIKFSIPEKYEGKFYVKIYTIIGEERMSYVISKTDKQIVISSGNLPSGIYLYALIANNDVLGIKQMVISK